MVKKKDSQTWKQYSWQQQQFLPEYQGSRYKDSSPKQTVILTNTVEIEQMLKICAMNQFIHPKPILFGSPLYSDKQRLLFPNPAFGIIYLKN